MLHYDIHCPKCGGHSFKSWESNGKTRYACRDCGLSTRNPQFIKIGEMTIDKKCSEFDIDEWLKSYKTVQHLKHKSSDEQDEANVIIKTDHDYIIYQPIGDMHIGSGGMNLDLFTSYTNALLEDDRIYSSLSGDDLDLFCSFKNFLASQQMILTPQEQAMFLEKWVDKIGHKLFFTGYGNHAEMEERNTAFNTTRHVLGRKLIYHNGIGRIRLHLNDIEYKICSTHKTRYNSSINQTHGLKQLARMDLPNEDIYIGADKHNPAAEMFPIGGEYKWFLQLSTLKANDGFGKRYFSYWHYADSPALILGTKEKSVALFRSMFEAQKVLGGIK